MQNLRGKVVVSLVFALIVVLGLAFYADAPQLVSALEDFDWRFLPLALGATLINYFLRFLRWHYYLDVIAVRGISRAESLLIFLTGFSLTLTPGKLGEVLKSLLLKRRHNTPISYTASIVIAERLTDVMGMLLLAATGFVFYPLGVGLLAIVVAGILIFVLLVQQRVFAEHLLIRGERLPIVGRYAQLGRNLYESAYLMLRIGPMIISITLATAAWFGECVAFFFVLMGIGLEPTPQLLLQGTFIYAAASLFGALSMLPGGLGATEGGMALLLQQIVGVAREQSVAAALVVRLCTLWFAVALGVIALLIVGIPSTRAEEGADSTEIIATPK